MADTKRGRDKQADDNARRQRNRDLTESRDRADEVEPMRDDPGKQLGALDDALETHQYPTTTNTLSERYGDYTVETQNGYQSVSEVFAPLDNQTYTSADDVRSHIQGLVRR